MSAATPRVNIDRGTRIKSACSLPPSAHHPPYLSPPSFSPSTFPPPLRLSLARSLPLNLRYLSLSGIHYRFYWGQSRQTDRPTDRPTEENSDSGGNEADDATKPVAVGRSARKRVDHATALFHSMPSPSSRCSVVQAVPPRFQRSAPARLSSARRFATRPLTE